MKWKVTTFISQNKITVCYLIETKIWTRIFSFKHSYANNNNDNGSSSFETVRTNNATDLSKTRACRPAWMPVRRTRLCIWNRDHTGPSAVPDWWTPISSPAQTLITRLFKIRASVSQITPIVLFFSTVFVTWYITLRGKLEKIHICDVRISSSTTGDGECYLSFLVEVMSWHDCFIFNVVGGCVGIWMELLYFQRRVCN